MQLAGKEALDQQEAYYERLRVLRHAGEEGLASLRQDGPQLESDQEFETSWTKLKPTHCGSP
jgi:hypothetical protein